MFAVHHEKKLCSCFFKVTIDHLFDNLESGKRNYCFGKKSGNSFELILEQRIYMHPVLTIMAQSFRLYYFKILP